MHRKTKFEGPPIQPYCVIFTTLRQEIPPGSRLDRTDLIKELDGTCIMAHQREAPTDTTELLTR